MTPKEYADKCMRKFRGQLRPGMLVPLAEYYCQHDMDRVADDPATTYIDQRERNNAFARLLIEAGCEPVFIQIDPDKYFQWLEDRENTPAARAAYAGWNAAENPEDYTAASGETEP